MIIRLDKLLGIRAVHSNEPVRSAKSRDGKTKTLRCRFLLAVTILIILNLRSRRKALVMNIEWVMLNVFGEIGPLQLAIT